MSSAAPPPSSSGPPVVELPDPVVEIIVGAGHRVGPGVVECAQLAAAAHTQRRADNRADWPEVNRSTFVWALGSVDVEVRAALDVSGIDVDEWGREIGIVGDHRPSGEPYALAEELARAIRTFVARPSKAQLTVTTWSLAVAVFEDIARHGGLVADRLRQFGTSAEVVLADLRMPSTQGGGASELPLVREVDARRFGVQLPRGQAPKPYVARDVDPELGRQLRERVPVVSVIARGASGAIRTVFEVLRRERPDDRILLLHEWLEGRTGNRQPSPEEVASVLDGGADVVWVSNLADLLLLHPVLEGWFRSRGHAVSPTVVTIVRPDFLEQARALGLAPATAVELEAPFSEAEVGRAGELYEGHITQAGAIASATPRRVGSTRATYAADSAIAGLLDDRTDDLDIRTDVDMIAKLIASRDVRPPLSIGLFGEWGSGKSFLMRQVQLRIKDLADRSRGLGEDETGYHSEIVPVEFNAWQYAHGEALWASLINRVFEEIRKQLRNDARYQEVLKTIADKDIGVAQARAKVVEAESAVARTRPAAEDRVIDEVAKDHGMTEDSTKQIKEGLDLDVAQQQVSDLKAEYDRLVSSRARLGKGWTAASAGRRALIVGLVVIGAVALALYVWAPDAFAQLLALAGGAVSLIGAVVQVLRPVNQGLEQAAKVLRADDADKRLLREALDELAQAVDELTAAKSSGLAGLYGFVSERSGAEEYRKQLGMAPMIRDDLERLAAKSREAEGLPGIDRVVIYIDDLDRCPPREVVRVLEAVNLLFGFELFVVVVAVDSRWLMQSLMSNFSEAFTSRDGSAPAPTPQNYLEKIIQIPFWVQPMHAEGFGRLVTSLAGEVDERDDNGGGAHAGMGGVSGAGMPAPSGGIWGGGHASIDPDDFGLEAPPLEGWGDTGTTAAETPDAEAEGPPETAEREQAEDLNPAALRLTSDERDLMKDFLPLVDTPRAVKRFLNTYQLLRVSVDDVDTFLDRREYAPVLVLLALMTGTAGLTDEMVRELALMSEPNFAVFLFPPSTPGREPSPEPRAGWEEVAQACDQLPTGMLTPEVIRDWMERVARYSFHHVGS